MTNRVPFAAVTLALTVTLAIAGYALAGRSNGCHGNSCYSRTTSEVCSRESLAACPASYFVGPLGDNNLIPAAPGAFLIDLYGGYGTTYEQWQTGVLQRETDMGRPFDGLGFHYDGGGTWDGVYGMNPPVGAEQWIHDHGSFPVISWTPNYTLTQMNAGAADAIWAKAAAYFASLGFPVMLRAFVEFDGTPTYAGCGAPLISAWQRMVNVFEADGASKVGFFWSPTEGQNRACISSSYPGDAYVDWVGSDWYNSCLTDGTGWCTPLHPGWASFDELFNYTALGSTSTSQHDAWGPHKPFVVGETGTWYDTPKGQWFRDIPAAAEQMQWLRGIEFYDSDVSAVEGARNNFRVDCPTSDQTVYDGWLAMAADPLFNS